MSQDLFNVPIFFILFRETTEAAIIVSVLLSFLRKMFHTESPVYKRLRNQVWIGSIVGLFICICIGAAFIAVYYTVLNDLWGNSEDIWEGVFSLVATVMITVMGLAMLKTERMQEKWKVKLAKAIQKDSREKSSFKEKLQKYAFFFLPFITVLREGLEAVVFIGGVSLGIPGKSIPIAAIMGIVCGCLVGLLIYRGGKLIHLRWFFVFSTVILYLVAAGLMSKGVGFLEQNSWNQVIGGEAADVISYRVSTSIWHVSWGDPELNVDTNGGWQIFNAILGWNNTATYGTIISYCLYWVFVICYLAFSFYKEKREAIRKAEAGEWDNGDQALDEARQYIDETGEIRQNLDSVESGKVDVSEKIDNSAPLKV
ncbi:high-affinity iron permease [Choanephora cucurbitarum]|nr:high-affinity iron permease [Choanephora cucurbitarum]